MSARLRAGETVYSAWVGSSTPFVAEALAQGSWDAVIVDMQHGAVGYDAMVSLVASVTGAGAPALVRIPLGDEGMIGRVLDAGAQGVIFPMINTGQEAARHGRTAKYPPEGFRSWGPARALEILGYDKQQYLTDANDLCMTWVMVETETALGNVDSILSSKAVDGVFVGPNDLCVSLSKGKLVDPSEKVVMDALDHILRKAQAHRVVPGIYANSPELARRYADMGFRFIALGNELTYARIGGEFLLDMVRNPDAEGSSGA